MLAEVAAIAKFALGTCDAALYTDNIPEGMKIPALYISAPTVSDAVDTTTTYQKQYVLSIKVFHTDTPQAFDLAEVIADEIRNRRSLIPLVNEAGEPNGQSLRIEQTDVKTVDTGVAQLTIKWRSRYHYHREAGTTVQRVTVTGKVKDW
ncbi:phage portal protein [Brevibacillus dissolubilis]|uniref:phage portal protein n=1 Tax=Brevibacillus dissolubilis TaxID=1844116 RepID=UPI001117904C|nr:phage portal protein [Brevibacillus dissolubilis]